MAVEPTPTHQGVGHTLRELFSSKPGRNRVDSISIPRAAEANASLVMLLAVAAGRVRG